MQIDLRQALLLLTTLLSVGGCGDRARFQVAAGIGPAPTLPPPRQRLIPTIKVAEAAGWRSDARSALHLIEQGRCSTRTMSATVFGGSHL